MRIWPKHHIKVAHGVLNMLALAFAITGLIAITIMPKNMMPDFHSAHSWIGITIITFYSLQWLLGFTGFLYPKFGEGTRRAYLAYHRFWGVCIFVMACGNSVLILGYYTALYAHTKNLFATVSGESLLINLFAGSIVVYGVLLVSVVTPDEYARPPGD
jgi:hypothetical protein